MSRIVSLALAGVLVASQAPCARGQAAPALSDRDRKVIADLVRDLGKPGQRPSPEGDGLRKG